jgi:hypothetical protein
MKEFGKKLNIKYREKEPGEKELFIDLISSLNTCWNRTNYLEEHIGLGIAQYEEPLYEIIENLIFTCYPVHQAEIMLWWVFERFDEEGNTLPVNYSTSSEEEFEEIIVETPEQLWDLIQKIKNK